MVAVGVGVGVAVGVVVGVVVAVGVAVGVAVAVAVVVGVGVVMAKPDIDRRVKTIERQVAAFGKLLEKLRELQASSYEVTEEMSRILGGAKPLGDTLKDFEGAFDRVWCERYAPGQPGRYVWAFAKDVPQMKRLLRSIGLEELKNRATNYLRNDDPFFVRARHSFGAFVASINQHADRAEAPRHREDEESPVVDCRHQPACRSDQEHTRRRAEDLRA